MADLPSGATTSEDLVPGWLVRLAAIGWRVLATLALAVVIFVVMAQLSSVVASIILALIIAATLAPYVGARRARGASRASAAGVVSLAAVGVLGVVVALVIIAVVPALSAIIDAFRNGVDVARDGLLQLGLPADVVALLERTADAFQGNMVDGLGAFVASAANVVTVAILGGFLTFFLLMDGDKSWDWLLAATDGWRREALMSGGQRALDQVGGYVRGTAITATATATLATVVLFVLGVPYAGALGVIVLIGSLVPYVGRAFSVFLIVTITLSMRGAVPAILLLALVLFGMKTLDRVLARLTSGRHLRMHPILAIVGLPIGLAVAGFAGLVVVLPVLAVAETATGVFITALGRDPVARRAAEAAAATATATTSEGVPVWLDRLGQWSWRALIVAALFAVVARIALQFPAVIMPIVMAVILAATLAPSATALQRRGMSRGTAAAAVTVGTGIALIVILGLALAGLVGPMAEIASTAQDGASSSGADALGIGAFVASIGVGLVGSVTDVIANLTAVIAVLLLGAFLTFFFIRDGANVWATLTDRVPTDRRGPLDAASSRAADVLGGYMIGTAAISAFGAATQWLIMVILGLPLALPIAILGLFAGFIPYIGGFITTGLAFLVAVAVGDQTDIVIMFIYTIVFNIVQGNFVTPLVYGKAVSLHPAIVLLAVPVGNALAGIVGMFLVVPVAGVIATTWRAILQTIDTADEAATAPVATPARSGAEPALDQ